MTEPSLQKGATVENMPGEGRFKRLKTHSQRVTGHQGGLAPPRAAAFLRSSRPWKASFPYRFERKKGTQLSAFLACSP